MPHKEFHVGQQLHSWLQAVTQTHTERGRTTQFFKSESLVLPCSCGQRTHTHTLQPKYLWQHCPHTHPFKATDTYTQRDINFADNT